MHQPMRYWPGPPPFATYGGASGNWGNGAGFGSGGLGPFGASQGIAIAGNEQVTTLATGLICIGAADGRLIPLVPMSSGAPSPFASNEVAPLASGLICVLSNGKVIPAAQQGAPSPLSNGQPTTAATGLVCIWGTDGKVIPMNLCGG